MGKTEVMQAVGSAVETDPAGESHQIDPDRSLPWLTVVTAVYGAEDYLADFIHSLEQQGEDLAGVRVVAVDDGSPDASGALLDAWAERSPGLVQVIHQENGGAAAARNAGLALVETPWVTFADPDDILESGYFRSVRAFLEANGEVSMAVTKLVFLHEATGQLTDSHPLRFRFERGNQVVDISRFPDYFHLSAATGFFRREVMEGLDLRFDERIRPNFEDGHFIVRYLLGARSSAVGFVADARYRYRKRAAGSSQIDTALTHPERFTNVLRFGYLDAAKRAVEATGEVPRWLQTLLVYELQWLLSADEGMFGRSAATVGVADEYIDLMFEIRRYIGTDAIRSYAITPMPLIRRLVLERGLVAEDWVTPRVTLQTVDTTERWVQLTYHFVGRRPTEEILVSGRVATTTKAKYRRIEHAERPMMWERIIWLPMRGTIEIRLDGVAMPLVRQGQHLVPTVIRAGDVDKLFGNIPRFRKPKAGVKNPKRSTGWWERTFGEKARTARGAARTQRIAESRLVRRFFADAWVLMDRDSNASDSAEHLFKHLRAKHREINGWFVIRRGTADWKRLRREGYKRVVPYGSFAWKLLALNATFMVSSHADAFVYRPPEMKDLGPLRWRFVFLQHGVTKDDISRWLRGKPIRLLVTTTTGEHESFVGDGSSYDLTAREVVRAGLPRHDRLVKLGKEWDGRRDTILVMPTWRHYLVGERDVTGARAADASFGSSDFATAWRALLTSDTLRELAVRTRTKVVLMPHPNLSPYLGAWGLPDWVTVGSYESVDVQEMIARAKVLVTDYTSVAFDAAVIRRPSVYYQFDRDRVFGGGHTMRVGYFDYARDGFGPVHTDAESVLSSVEAIVGDGGRPQDEYLARMEQALPHRGGSNSERVVKAIAKIEKDMRWV